VCVVDFNYLMEQVSAGKVKRPWRRMSKRKFKKHACQNLDYDEIFILATNAKVGDVYYEHEENHRICEIRVNEPESSWPSWDQMEIDTVQGLRCSSKSRIKITGFLINEVGASTCGCGHLSLPVSVDMAAEMELMNCLSYFNIDRLRGLSKKYGWYRSEHEFLNRFSWCIETRDDPGFALYVDWAKRAARIYDRYGPLTMVDEDGVLLESYRATRSDIWKMCWSSKEEEG